ncbi:MAG: GNAT family N-acetyltransferase [Bacteroidia bacterium]|jgi:aminoglycoside 3-N-acetyltransferase I|nr:GNAT family N-acetyltransferase [Bacteroidia bacterium]
MEIKKLNSDGLADFKSLIEIFKEVFENDEPIANDEQLGKLLTNPDFLVFVVLLNNEVVGGLTIYVLHRYYGTKPIAYIYDVGVSPKFQGQGLGKALIAEVGNFCKQNGFEDAYVEAESDDIDAVSFYRKTKFSSEMNAIHFTYDLTN